MRQLQDIIEGVKKANEQERSAVDANNLTLQSFLYEQSYFLKEIHFCKEFKTPQLKKALPDDEYKKF